MNFITTTDLRTKSSALVESLRRGKSVSLIHRSKVVGVIAPANQEAKTFTRSDINTVQEAAKKLNLPHISYAERKRRYRRHLADTYGKDIS